MAKSKRGSNQASKGSKWIRPDKRLAIYLRDDFKCLWCKKHVAKEIQLQIDHLNPYSTAKDDPLRNDPSNMVSACRSCNSKRKDMSVEEFALVVSRSTREKPQNILKRIAEQTSQFLDFYRTKAKAILAAREAGDPEAGELIKSTRAQKKEHYEYG